MKVGNVTLEKHTPSVIPTWELVHWVKFSVGDLTDDHFRYGAVKPPTPEIGWLPAAIGTDTVLVATSETFASPEEAVDWLRTAG